MVFNWGPFAYTNEFRWARFLSEDFVLTPLFNSKDIVKYNRTIFNLQRNYGTKIVPILIDTTRLKITSFLNFFTIIHDMLLIFRTIKNVKPDVIICHYIFNALPLLIFKKLFNYRLFTFAIGSDVNLHKRWGWVKKIVYRGSDIIFAVAHDLKNKIEEENGCTVIVVPSGVDTSFFKAINSKVFLRKKWDVKIDDIVILTVAKLNKRKGIHLLLKSLKIINNYKIKLLIAGTGRERTSLNKLVSKLQLKNISFLGFREEQELLELYNLADFFILPSFSEGLPVTLLEAMACGCVPITTDVGDIREVVIDGFNGFIITPIEPEKIAETVMKVISLSEEELTAIRSSAISTIVNHYDNRNIAKSIIKYAKLLGV
jgi:glycosyltransferase involved in cell wall biosynthesis